MFKKSIIVLLVLAMLIALPLGCKPKEKAAEPSGTLIVGGHEASGNFNPLYYSSAYDGFIVDLVFQRLITRNWDGIFEGVVAKDWEFSNGDKTITFVLRDDIVFSDGVKLTAEDVAFTYLVMADPSYTGRYGSVVKDMLGYDEYAAGESNDFPGVEVVDPYTVAFHFKEAMRVNFANCDTSIMPKHYYGADFTPGNTAAVEAITSAPIGSGPYLVDKFAEKELVFLKRNALYADEGYLIAEIIYKFVDMTTDIVELTSGDVDLLMGMIEPTKIAAARAAGKSLNSYDRSGYGYVRTNCQFGPTADPVVRQALYYSFNVREFTENYFKDDETGQLLAGVQYHPFSQVSWAITDELLAEMIEYEFDLAKADQLLNQAGWVKNAQGFREKDGEIMELKIAAMPDHDILATLIPMWERDWGQGLGIKLDVAYLEFNTLLDFILYNSDANIEKWSLFFLAVSFTSPDPHSLYTSFHSKYVGSGQSNFSRYNNPEVDRLFDVGAVIMDEEEARPTYAKIAKILNEEAAMMPVYANTYFDLYDPKLVDFNTHSLFNWVKAMKDARIVEIVE